MAFISASSLRVAASSASSFCVRLSTMAATACGGVTRSRQRAVDVAKTRPPCVDGVIQTIRVVVGLSGRSAERKRETRLDCRFVVRRQAPRRQERGDQRRLRDELAPAAQEEALGLRHRQVVAIGDDCYQHVEEDLCGRRVKPMARTA